MSYTVGKPGKFCTRLDIKQKFFNFDDFFTTSIISPDFVPLVHIVISFARPLRLQAADLQSQGCLIIIIIIFLNN